MLAFILNKQNFNFNNNFNTKQQNAKFENIDLEIKSRINKIIDFNPEDNIDITENSEENETQKSFKLEKSGKTDANKSIISSTSKYRSNYFLEKVKIYKKVSSLAEIATSILIIFGSFISIIENNKYYLDNFYNRVFATTIINEMRHYTGNITGMSLNDLLINLTLWKILDEDPARVTSRDIYYNKTNSEIISLFQVEKDFNYYQNSSSLSYKDITVPLQVSSSGNILRYILLITSILACCLNFISRYLDYLKEYVYKKESDTPFRKTEFFYFMLFEILTISIFQYPNINFYFIQFELGNTIIFPISTILSSICIFRLCYSFKIFKNITKWSTLQAESICEAFVCKANSSFAFKALQKEYPFITLTGIFLLTCICFGFSLRNFELLYWESQEVKIQDWTYEWNAVWCIFVAMTTVGYGDFFPKTHLGRFLVIVACLVGTYFVSMMMVFMTQKSILDESEFKAYKLITRLKLRREIKSIQAVLVYKTLELKKSKNQDGEAYEKHKNTIQYLIEKINSKNRRIRTFEVVATKEQLFDICERIDNDIKDMYNELESIHLLNEIIKDFTDSQIESVRFLKKNIYAMKLIYKEIINSKKFGNLNNLIIENVVSEDEDASDNDKGKSFYNRSLHSKDNQASQVEIDISTFNINENELKSTFEVLINNPYSPNKKRNNLKQLTRSRSQRKVGIRNIHKKNTNPKLDSSKIK